MKAFFAKGSSHRYFCTHVRAQGLLCISNPCSRTSSANARVACAPTCESGAAAEKEQLPCTDQPQGSSP